MTRIYGIIIRAHTNEIFLIQKHSNKWVLPNVDNDGHEPLETFARGFKMLTSFDMPVVDLIKTYKINNNLILLMETENIILENFRHNLFSQNVIIFNIKELSKSRYDHPVYSLESESKNILSVLYYNNELNKYLADKKSRIAFAIAPSNTQLLFGFSSPIKIPHILLTNFSEQNENMKLLAQELSVTGKEKTHKKWKPYNMKSNGNSIEIESQTLTDIEKILNILNYENVLSEWYINIRDNVVDEKYFDIDEWCYYMIEEVENDYILYKLDYVYELNV